VGVGGEDKHAVKEGETERELDGLEEIDGE